MRRVPRKIRNTFASAVPFVLVACGGAQREATSTTATTGATYTPGAVELYVARSSAGEGACTTSLSPTLQFGTGTDVLLPGEEARLAGWALCLERPELAHTTVVLVGGDEVPGPEGLFVRRASVIRRELVRRGVEHERVLVGAPGAAREGGRTGATSSVRLELTASETLRALAPGHPPVTGGVGHGVR